MRKKQGIVTPEVYCPIRQTLHILGKKWTMLIVKEVYYSQGNRIGFMDLRRRLSNLSTKVLSERLKEMAQNGLINRKVDSSVTPARVHYTLTGKGRDACKILEEFKQYGLKWGQKEHFSCKDVDCELCPHKTGDK